MFNNEEVEEDKQLCNVCSPQKNKHTNHTCELQQDISTIQASSILNQMFFFN